MLLRLQRIECAIQDGVSVALNALRVILSAECRLGLLGSQALPVERVGFLFFDNELCFEARRCRGGRLAHDVLGLQWTFL